MNIEFLFMPKYWLMNNPYSKEWDTKLNELIDEFEPVIDRPNLIDGLVYIIYFGDYGVWVQNYPYGYGNFYTHKNGKVYPRGYRPSRKTIMRLRKVVEDKKNGLGLNVINYD